MDDTCVARVPIFASLSPADQQLVAGLARSTHLSRGDAAYSAHDRVSRLMVLHQGRLKIFRLSPDGAEQLIRVLEPGDFTGETAVLTGRRPDDYATALDDCQLCVFRHDDLEKLIARHPAIGLQILATLSQRLSDTEQRLNALTSRDVDTRLADYLLALPSTWTHGIAEVTLPLPKKDIASLLDTTPETLSRAFRRLSADGVIAINARRVQVRQPERLQELVDEG